MAGKTVWKDNARQTLTISGSDNDWTLAATATVTIAAASGFDYGIRYDLATDTNNDVTINGRIFMAAGIGLYMLSHGGSVNVGAKASIIADRAIQAHGAITVNNYGTLTATGEGIQAWSSGVEVHNYGKITAYYGIEAVHAESTITNEKSGEIFAYGSAFVSSKGAATFVNHGYVEAVGGSMVYFDKYNNNSTIRSDGTMIGDINLHGGTDVVDLRGGNFTGAIHGYGNMTLITDDASIKLTVDANVGVAVVQSTVSYTLNVDVANLTLIGKANANGTGNEIGNVLTGNRGNNVLNGAAGSDRLVGEAGNDRLIGGSGIDTFVFATGFGKDVIADYEAFDEHIDITGWQAVDDYSELFSHMKSRNGGILIEFGKDSLFIEHATKDDLGESHFVM